MNKWKEVWYPWKHGKKLPEGAVLLKLSNSWIIPSTSTMVKSVLDERFDTTIVAYTKGEKRRKTINGRYYYKS